VALLSVSPLASRSGAAVLVAGCGTGAELIEARSQRPDWHLTALDPSAAMLSVARERLGSTGGIEWEQARVEDLQALDHFHGALAVLVLQSLPDDGSKLAFLTALARTLQPGGQLVLVDLMQPERSALRNQLEEAWSAFQQASGLQVPSDVLASVAHGLHPIGTGRLTALADAAGFTDPAPVFRALAFEGFLLQRRA
jgi:tRNA (cmo5U34)-methyltransferase